MHASAMRPYPGSRIDALAMTKRQELERYRKNYSDELEGCALYAALARAEPAVARA